MDDVDSEILNLNDCGCCEGVATETPVEVYNRPGLGAVAYRVGTQVQFKQSLLARLSAGNLPALRQLTSREADDFAIALLDAWATVADVLTFYQERIANESYLRTATERLSLVQLARLLGYKLRPGVAASTYLAFTLEDAPGAPRQATIEVGTRVQSVPATGEQAQTFETVEKIAARTEWNAIRPRLTQLPPLSPPPDTLMLPGTATNVQPGNKVLILSGGSPVLRSVIRVVLDAIAQTTRIYFANNASFPGYSEPSDLPQGTVLTDKIALTQSVIQTQILAKRWREQDLLALAAVQGWSIAALVRGVAEQLAQVSPGQVFVFRQTASLFGYNAPKRTSYGSDGKPVIENGTLKLLEWSPQGEASDRLYLDSAYEGIAVGSYVAILKPGKEPQVRQVTAVTTSPHTEYGMSGKITALLLDAAWWHPKPVGTDDFDVIRNTSVVVQSEPLPLAKLPIPDLVQGKQITLDGVYLGLRIGQTAILTGDRADLAGVAQTELITITDVAIVAGYTQIALQQALSYPYRRDSVFINANVAFATHGETVQEIMGGGNASQPYQSFSLRQPPLTYTSSDTAPDGAQSTLQVRVNEVLWHEVPMLYGQKVTDRVYTTRQEEDGKTTVQFGDGKTGTRLPTGQTNVKATYRKGIGRAGNLKAGQLSTLLTRPLGVKDAINPQAATGGDDPETLDQARQNLPLTILTLDRIVSLQDYEDFARAFAGVAKALATWTWDGQSRGVFVTIAGPNGVAISPDQKTYQNLVSQMKKSGDPHVPLRVKSYTSALFHLAAKIQVNPDFQTEQVLATVKQTLQAAFSFDARAFGQGVALSEVVAVMQAVPGVMAIDVDFLYRIDGIGGNGLKAPLPAAFPQAGTTNFSPAELLTLDPASLENLTAVLA
jgi:predicted phage baseplate assembly protein